MVLSLIRGDADHGGFDHIMVGSVAMLGDAKHSFELATRILLTEVGADGTAAEAMAQDVRDTDRRINRTEQGLRSDLVDHVCRHGNEDIETVLGLTLLLKKIERCGDHAKNILELTENGVSLAAVPETEALLTERETMAGLFTTAAELLGSSDHDSAAIDRYVDRVHTVIADCQARIDSYMTSDRPGSEVVPLAIYHRFHRRIAANLLGVVRAWAEPAHLVDLDRDLDAGPID
ncbi:MAG: PhoU domain-containing protein [Actinomycetota bacterium]